MYIHKLLQSHCAKTLRAGARGASRCQAPETRGNSRRIQCITWFHILYDFMNMQVCMCTWCLGTYKFARGHFLIYSGSTKSRKAAMFIYMHVYMYIYT